MSPKKRISHVPGEGEVITKSASPSSLDRTSLGNAAKPVTLESLASDIEGIRDQIAIVVEWLQTLDERTGSGE